MIGFIIGIFFNVFWAMNYPQQYKNSLLFRDKEFGVLVYLFNGSCLLVLGMDILIRTL